MARPRNIAKHPFRDYSIAGMMVAVNDGTGLQYLLTDHLGSTVAVTNSSGTLTSQQRYLPFGAPRAIPNSPILGTDFTYTGQRKLDDSMGGIMDYKARFYSPYLNRFLQPDTDVPASQGVQGLNRYAYVNNNPIRYTDPSGHEIKLPPCIFCNITWFNYTKLTITINSDPNPSRAGDKLMDIAFSLGCAVVGCRVDTKKNEVKGPTTGEWATSNLFAMATPLHMPTFYRGYKNNTLVLKSNAAQEHGYAYSQSLIDAGNIDELMALHAKNSSDPASPFVSVTTDPRVAEHFAGDGGYIYELDIPADRVTRNPYNDYVIPGGIPENEWLVPNYIRPSEIKKITKKIIAE
jgi:RHS repeat-associated protein